MGLDRYIHRSGSTGGAQSQKVSSVEKTKQKENSKSSHRQLSVEFASARDKWRPRKRKETGDLCSSPPPTVSSYRGCMMPEKESLIMQREAGAATTLTCRPKNTAVGPAHSSHRLEYMTYQICKHSGQ